MKKFFNFIFSRIFFISLMLVFQLTLLILFLIYFNKYFIYLYGINLIVAIVFTSIVVSDDINPAFKITWILIIITIPILGGFVYLLFGEKHGGRVFFALVGIAKKGGLHAIGEHHQQQGSP